MAQGKTDKPYFRKFTAQDIINLAKNGYTRISGFRVIVTKNEVQKPRKTIGKAT